jgi:hypothetical protein
VKAEKIECRTPTPNKKPTRIAKTKFDLVRRAILRVIPKKGNGVAFSDLFALVEDELTPNERKAVGSIPWYVTTVKLEMEVRGELERVPNVTPQRLRRG